MRRVKVILVAALVAAALAVPAFAGPRQSAPKQGQYAVTNPNHTQTLGGRSERSCRGLSRAAERSPSVNPTKGGGLPPNPKP